MYKTPYEKLIEQRLLRPLKMSSTGFSIKSADQSRLAQGYSRSGKLIPYHLRNAGAAYGLYSTPRDMAKYLRWQLAESDPVIHIAQDPIEGNQQSGESLIWNLTLDERDRLLWHGGGTFGMSSQVVLYPEDREEFALLANDTCAGTEDALTGTEDALKNIAIMAHRSVTSTTGVGGKR